MNYQERKQARRDYYNTQVDGWKLRVCGACSGTGYYDDNDSPECDACGGTGKEKYKQEEKDGKS